MNSFKQTFLTSPANFQRLTIGALLLVCLLVCWSNISHVHASASGPIPPKLSGQQPAQASDVDTLVQAAYELYLKAKFDDALAKCAEAKALNPNDFRPHAIAG